MFIFDDHGDFMVTGVSRTQHGGVCYAGPWNSKGTLENVDPDDSFLPKMKLLPIRPNRRSSFHIVKATSLTESEFPG